MKVELKKLEKLGYGKKEAFNSLRINLSFCGDDIHVIAFTSCTPDEGKSSTVMELGRSLAEDGKRVLFWTPTYGNRFWWDGIAPR